MQAAVWAVWAVRAARGKILLCMGGAGGGGGARARGLGMDWEPVLEPLKHCFSWPGRGYRSSEGGAWVFTDADPRFGVGG